MHIDKKAPFRYLVRIPNGKPGNYPHNGQGVPLRITQYIPMRLKEVTDKKLQEVTKKQQISCMNELMTLLECYEKHDFSTESCSKQAHVLENCYTTHMSKQRKSNKLDQKFVG